MFDEHIEPPNRTCSRSHHAFSVVDAETLVDFAKEKQLGLLSMRRLDRDHSCPKMTYGDLANDTDLKTGESDQFTK